MNIPCYLITPFERVGGRLKFTPPAYTIIQTGGSYTPRSRKQGHSGAKGQVATMIYSSPAIVSNKFIKAVTATSSTEAEWIAVVFGLQKALDQNLERIAIENDCLSLVESTLIPNYMARHEYARHYREQIHLLAKYTEWTGLRWIPRELNRADDLFR